MYYEQKYTALQSKEYYELCAYHGAKLMDSKRPGWYRRIKRELLDMAMSSVCILGQNYGWYSEGRERLGLPSGEASKYGFVIPVGMDVQDESFAYSMLTEAWLSEIDKRIK
jgi:hypothetical protein